MKTNILICSLAFFLASCAPKQQSLSGNIIDLTYALDSTSVFWPTADGFVLENLSAGYTPGGYYYAANNFSSAEHGGTHIDAPVHFAEGKHSVDEIPIDQLIGPGIVIDVSKQCEVNWDYLISAEDFQNWETQHGKISKGSIVLLRTGFGKYWPDRAQYMGTAERGDSAVKKLHFPGLDPVAAKWVVENGNIKAIGLDTPSIDYGQSTLFESHVELYTHNVPAFENVANLDQLPVQGFTVIALPMKIKGGSGGPLRIIAVVP